MARTTLFGVSILLNSTLLTGCGYLYLDLFTCAKPDLDHVDPVSGQPDPCHEFDRDAAVDADTDAAGDDADAAGDDAGDAGDAGADAGEDAAADGG